MHHDPANLQKCIIYENSTWVEHSKFRKPRHYAVSVVMDSGDIYVLGGSYSPTTSDVLYMGNDNWSEGPNLTKNAFIFKACAASINSTHFLTVGGGIFYNQVSVFNTVSSTWTDWPNLHDRRRGHNCARFGEKIVVAGGYLFGDQDYTSSSVLIDINTGASSPGGEMLKRRAYYSVQVLHGILYAIGGSTFHHETTVERLLDPAEAWTTSDLNLTTGRSTFATVKCAPTVPSTYGQNLLKAVTIRTKVGCSISIHNNCSFEGVLITLKGGSRQDQPDSLNELEGVSCSTAILDHPDTIDFGDGGVATFGGGIGGGVTMHDEREMLKDCYQVSWLFHLSRHCSLSRPPSKEPSWRGASSGSVSTELDGNRKASASTGRTTGTGWTTWAAWTTLTTLPWSATLCQVGRPTGTLITRPVPTSTQRVRSRKRCVRKKP